MEKNIKISLCQLNKLNENWIYISIIFLCILSSNIFYTPWAANYKMVHTILEIICIFVGFSIFLISWQMLDKSSEISRIIGFGFLIITIFGIFHTTYFQINIFDYFYCREITCKFWIISRFALAFVLLGVSLKSPMTAITNKYKLLLISIFISAAGTVLVFMFPFQFRLWTVNGLTNLKIILEHMVILILIMSLIKLNNTSDRNKPVNFKYVRFAIISAIVSEFCFTLYQNDLTSYFNNLGHLLWVVCSGYLFIGVYMETAEYPYNEALMRLNLSQNLFVSLFENSPNGISIVSMKGEWIKINRYFKEVFGNNFCSYKEIFYEEDEEFNKHIQELCSSSNSSYKFKKRYENQFGELKWMLVTESLVRDTKGNPLYLISQIVDISDYVEKDYVIKRQKEELETMIENMSDWVIALDKMGNITSANKVVRENINNIMEIGNIESLLENIEVYDYRGRVFSDNKDFNNMLKGDNSKEIQYTVRNHDRAASFEINCTAVCDKENLNSVMIIGHDVTNRLKNEEALLIKTQYNLMNNIIERLELGFVRFNYPDYKIIDMNHKYYDTLKYISPEIGPINSIIGKTLDNIHPFGNKDEMKLNIKNLIDKNMNSYYTYKNIKVGTCNKYYKILHQPIYGLNHKILEEVIISIDITEEVELRKKMEENLKVQEDIFANISHELKTPLNVIFCTNQLTEFYLKEGLIRDDDRRILKNINVVKQNCYRFTKIINNVVDLSKMESGFYKLNLSNENIVQLVEDIVLSVSDYISQKDIDIIFDTDVEEKYIACDPDKIERIVLNLISNAIKFTNPGGKIYVNVFDENDSVEIWVQDTGIGMDEKSLNDIFKRFHQVDKSLSRNSEGSGIGLSLVKSIVDLHKGRIWVESKPGKGSTFKIMLPAVSLRDEGNPDNIKAINSKVEKINIEFSDIYSIQ